MGKTKEKTEKETKQNKQKKNKINCGSSHRRCFVKNDVLRYFPKFTGKHLCQSFFFNISYSNQSKEQVSA